MNERALKAKAKAYDEHWMPCQLKVPPSLLGDFVSKICFIESPEFHNNASFMHHSLLKFLHLFKAIILNGNGAKVRPNRPSMGGF